MTRSIGIDVGGTFVDVVVWDGARLLVAKLESDPEDPSGVVLTAMERVIGTAGGDGAGVERIAHGTTVATNALLERSWARTALVTTRGFGDLLTIGRQNRRALYDLRVKRPESIVPHGLHFEAAERVDADGTVHVPLSDAAIDDVVAGLAEADVEAVAVCFLFSYLRPEHERRVGRRIGECLGLPVTLSSDLVPEFREYERASTTVVNACLLPVVGERFARLADGAARLGASRGWEVMQSGGSMVPAEMAGREPARLLLSGPAAGVEGARAVGRLLGFDDLITLDMGGTSCDVSLVLDGDTVWTRTGEVAGYPVALPKIDIHTIGAGGGSIATIDAGGALVVGPRSAGAEPGPCCYGRGGAEATVTDAHVALGRIPVGAPIGGLGRLDVAAARRGLSRIAAATGRTIEGAALGVLDVADAAMERAIRRVTVERGHDPRQLALLAFGGAGPLHAVELARRLEIPRVIVPAYAGVLSAVGLLTADTAVDVSQGVVRLLSDLPLAAVAATVDELFVRGRDALGERAAGTGQLEARLTFDLRYVGQSHELSVLVQDGPVSSLGSALGCEGDRQRIVAAFHALHDRRYGHAEPERATELVAVRLRVVIPGTGLPAEILGRPRPMDLEDSGLPTWSGGVCDVWFDTKGPLGTRVVRRRELEMGDGFDGPLIVVGRDATVVIPPGCHGRTDGSGHLLLEVG